MRCAAAFVLTLLCLRAMAAPAEPGALFYAGFDGSPEAYSASGAGIPLAVEGEAAYEPGKVGQALVCGPEAASVRYRLPGNLLPSAGTVSLWVKPLNWTPDDPNFHVFLEAGSEGGSLGWLLFYKYFQNGWLLFRLADEKGRFGMAYRPLAWKAGEWRHIAATWSPEALRIYEDGELIARADQPPVAEKLGDSFRIGDRGWHLPHKGARTLIDEVRIYPYPLPLSEIERLARRAPLALRRDPLAEKWHVEARLPDPSGAASARIEVFRSGSTRPALTADASIAGDAVRASLPIRTLASGSYTVTAAIVDAKGETLFRAGPVPAFKPVREQVALANDRIRLVFDGATGGILSLESLKPAFSARARAAPVPILSFETVRFPDHARYYAARDVLIPIAEGALRSLTVERTKTGRRLRAEYRYAPRIEAWATADLPDGSPVATFRLRLKNARPVRPSEAVFIPRITFPALSGLQIGKDPSDDALASGRVQGEVIRPAAANLPEERVLHYPGFACVPWLDLHDAGGGLALLPLTDGRVQLEAVSGAKDSLVDISSRWWSLLRPGEVWDSPPVEIAAHPGRWHWTADRFREWSLKRTPPRPQPDWLGRCDGWLGLGGPTYTFRDLPRVLDAARYYGFFYVQLWSQMILGEQYYSYFYPNPALGTENDLREGIRRVHRKGGRIGFYSNAITFDAAIDANPDLKRTAAKYNLKNLPLLPRFWGEMERNLFTDPAGRYGRSEAGYLDGYWAMCPGAKGWQDYLYNWIHRWQTDYGCDIWYLDSFPIFGYGLGPACFAEHHARPQGLGVGQIDLLRRIRKGYDGPLLYEGPACAAFMPYTNWVLGEEFAFGTDRFSRPDIFAYSFSDVYPVFAGSCNVWQGVSHFYDDLPNPRHEDAVNRVFLIGERFDTLGLYPLNRESSFGEHIKKLVALRQKVRDIVYQGRFYEALGLSGMPPKAEARVFIRKTRPGVILTLLDRRVERSPWVLSIDTSALPWPAKLSRATLLSLDGSSTPARMSRQGRLVRLEIQLQEEISTVRVE
ncbi:MAG: hypothetical protein IT210_25755 [Armatimonadetes bacterium]|nr:hypothetical protein [Armatimonadota bacterium]